MKEAAFSEASRFQSFHEVKTMFAELIVLKGSSLKLKQMRLF